MLAMGKFKMKIEFYKAGCKKFFKKYSNREAAIKKMISASISKESSTGMTKVKLASKQRINELPIYEFRLNIGKIGSVRIAFTISAERATVYYITSKLQKATFSQEFAKIIENIHGTC